MKRAGAEVAAADDVSLPTRERELKLGHDALRVHLLRSLPTRERELKRRHRRDARHARGSLPTRERELKRVYTRIEGDVGRVAPYTGA